jgi:hypothetical protein
MPRTGFLPTAQVERMLAFAAPEAREIALEVRNIVAGVAPEAVESALWGGISYHDARKGGRVRGAICAVRIRNGAVELPFIHGVRLADPDGLLQGAQKSKRSLRIASYDAAPWEAIRRLVAAAASLEPLDFGPVEARPVE